MTRIRVRTDGGKVRIKLRDEAKAPVVNESTGAEVLKPRESPALLSSHLINLMEIRAESVFRPGEEDVEIVYALSGASENTLDTLHKLSSHTVVEEAAEDHIVSSVQGMLEHVMKERDSEPRLVVEVHTHPQGIPRPSPADKQFFKAATGRIRDAIPDINVLFAVHAVSSESIRERKELAKVSRNTIKWTSITREHEVAFYTPDGRPCEVEVSG